MLKKRDHLDREVISPIFPQRIVSLCPSITETLIELVGTSRMVGRTRFCIHPKEKVKHITRVGGTKEIKMDRLHALNPDLIIAEKEENTPEMVAELEKHYPVYVVDVKTLDEGLQMILDVGEWTQSLQKAEEIHGKVYAEMTSFKAYESSLSVLYFIWQNPWMVVGQSTYIDSMLSFMGVENMGVSFSGRYPQLDAAQLSALSPDEVWLSSEPYPFGNKDIKSFQQIFPHAHVRLVDGEMFSWYGVRMLEAFPYVRKMMGSHM